MNPWMLLTKYRIEHCCNQRSCRKWTIRDFGSGKRVGLGTWDTWEQAIDEVQRRQTSQYYALTGQYYALTGIVI